MTRFDFYKYGDGLQFVIAGDTNDLNLTPILNLDPKFCQIVREWTRLDPPAILDPVMMTISNFYQEPQCLDPLDHDQDKTGCASDHRIVLVKPVSTLHPEPSRRKKIVNVRSYSQSALEKFKNWLIDYE